MQAVQDSMLKLQYLLADRILQKIISQRSTKHGNVYKTQCLGLPEINYVVEVAGIYAHGNSVKQARESLIYKMADRDTSAYDAWTLKKSVTRKQAVQSYMTITGACEEGTRQFVETVCNIKSRYTVGEIISITKGQYRCEVYKAFFNEREQTK